MATKNHQSDDSDAQLLITLDLAILGAESEKFEDYRRSIQHEAMSFPGYTGVFYRERRMEWAKSFLLRHPIFPTKYGQEQYESRARENLQRIIHDLAKGHLPLGDSETE